MTTLWTVLCWTAVILVAISIWRYGRTKRRRAKEQQEVMQKKVDQLCELIKAATAGDIEAQKDLANKEWNDLAWKIAEQEGTNELWCAMQWTKKGEAFPAEAYDDFADIGTLWNGPHQIEAEAEPEVDEPLAVESTANESPNDEVTPDEEDASNDELDEDPLVRYARYLRRPPSK